MTLTEWAARHNVTPAALRELSVLLVEHELEASVPELSPRGDVGTSEAAVQARTRVAVSQLGWRVWRNNIGAGKLADGSFVRWGLANDSSAINQSLKSADLIGIRPMVIESMHIGRTIGQFVSLECKPADWHYTGTPREVAQEKWAALITFYGGHARFVNDERNVL